MVSRTRTLRRYTSALLLFAASCAFAGAAYAEPTASEKETARTMMDEGHARRDAGDHRAALAQFLGADAIMRVPTTGIEVAREQVALGQLVEARDTLERVVRSPVAADEPDAFRLARKAADTLDQSIASRIASLRIRSDAPAGAKLEVTVDGTAIPVAALIAPIKVNPGRHVVAATVDGTVTRQEITLSDGQTAAVSLTPAPGATPPSSTTPLPASAMAAPGAPESSPAPTTSSAVPWLRWGGLGLAGAGLVIGGVTGAMSLSSTSSANKSCVNNRCPPSTWGEIDSARTTATVSDVAFVAAGIGAALFATSFLVGHGSASGDGSAAARPHVTAYLGPGSAFVAGTF